MTQIINKRLSWLLVGIFFIAAVMILAYANNKFYQEFLADTEKTGNYVIPKRPVQQPALVEVDFGNGKKRLFSGELGNDPQELKSSLKDIAAIGRFSFKEKNGRITEVAGIGSNGKWLVYQNGDKVDLALDNLNVWAGDKYTLRFEPR